MSQELTDIKIKLESIEAKLAMAMELEKSNNEKEERKLRKEREWDEGREGRVNDFLIKTFFQVILWFGACAMLVHVVEKYQKTEAEQAALISQAKKIILKD